MFLAALEIADRGRARRLPGRGLRRRRRAAPPGRGAAPGPRPSRAASSSSPPSSTWPRPGPRRHAGVRPGTGRADHAHRGRTAGERGRRRPGVPAAVHPARLARPDRALRGAAGPRPGRLRHRLPGVRRRAAARRRGQGAGPAAGRHLAGPQAVPARGPVVGRRSGTRTSCRSTRSGSSRCRTW